LSARKEKEAAGRRAEANRKEKEEEARRALEDVRRKELERQRKERENIKIEEAKKLAKSLQDRGSLKVNMDVSR
jgi:translation initiation factor 3 subunit A